MLLQTGLAAAGIAGHISPSGVMGISSCAIGAPDAYQSSFNASDPFYKSRSISKSQDIVCPYCGKVFLHNNTQAYQRHIIVHTEEKPFQCSLCSFKCNQRSNLRRHEKTIHS